MIQITTPNIREAAHQIIPRLDGKAWLIWSISDEGYMMTPVNSPEATSVLRFWPESIAGTYTTARVKALEQDLLAAKKAVALHEDNRTIERREYERLYKQSQRAKLKQAA